MYLTGNLHIPDQSIPNSRKFSDFSEIFGKFPYIFMVRLS